MNQLQKEQIDKITRMADLFVTTLEKYTGSRKVLVAFAVGDLVIAGDLATGIVSTKDLPIDAKEIMRQHINYRFIQPENTLSDNTGTEWHIF